MRNMTNYSVHDIQASTFVCDRCRQKFLRTPETIKYHSIEKKCKHFYYSPYRMKRNKMLRMKARQRQNEKSHRDKQTI